MAQNQCPPHTTHLFVNVESRRALGHRVLVPAGRTRDGVSNLPWPRRLRVLGARPPVRSRSAGRGCLGRARPSFGRDVTIGASPGGR